MNYVVAGRYDGAGARIVAIINALRLAKRIGCEFKFLWPEGKFFKHENLNHIFSASFVEKFHINERYILDYSANSPKILKAVMGGRRFPGTTPEEAIIEVPHDLTDKYDIWIVNNNYGFYCFKYEDLDIVRWELSNLVNISDIFCPAIICKLLKFRSSVEGCEKLLGVHVRRGDITSSPKDQWRVIDLEQYHQKISSMEWDRLVLCTDSDKIIQEFNRKYPKLVIVEDSNEKDRVMEADAVLDVLKLSCCQIVIGGKSAFSEAARIIGNKKLLVLNNSNPPGLG